MGDLSQSDWLSGDPSNSKCYDIVIVGAGPAGLMLAACLARWGYRIRHIDHRAQPTAAGRADGIQPRSLDILCSMGLKPVIMSHGPARSYETAFWVDDGPGRGIVRTGTSPSCPDFIGARYPFTTLLHQGYIEKLFISDMEKRGSRVLRPWTITKFETTLQNSEYPIVVETTCVDGTTRETIRAKYLFSGEGAHSSIRKKLQISVNYKEHTASAWGVIDGTVRSDFPDLRIACSIHSTKGSAMFIPRERDMVRLYVQAATSSGVQWDGGRHVSKEEIQRVAKEILRPYFIEWDHVDWYSTYVIRQGVADRYTLDQRVFLGGDACHVHSVGPKAGQGMNTAFSDAHNLAWKIHHVEMGFAHRDLLKTYESERRSVADTLIDFDHDYANLYSQQHCATDSAVECKSLEGSDLRSAYKASRAFVSGYGVQYASNILNWSPTHPAQSACFITTKYLAPGSLFLTADVTRVVDAHSVHLEQIFPLNGSFRIFIFAGRPASTRSALQHLSVGISDAGSFFCRHRHARGEDDVRRIPTSSHEHNPHNRLFTICIIFAARHCEVDIAHHVPGVLAGCRHHIYADDGGQGHERLERLGGTHAKAGLDPENGGVVVVRPDGYVGAVVKLMAESSTSDALNQYFAALVKSHDN